MRLSFILILALWLTAFHVHAAAVFAHFMVGNVPTWDLADWRHNIQLAQEAHIDAFALNIANGWYANEDTLDVAFEAAGTDGFALFFSFDYAGNGSWAEADVISLINKYKYYGGYYLYNGAPFVSTFEGPANAKDWANIKNETGCFFVPDWSSVGAIPASEEADGVVDGLFSWASWPWGNLNMTTFVDASYIETLNSSSKPYMMPVSPWFYTNMPGYDKNWLWRGDDSWYQRWIQIWYLQPEFVEIISWNDFGESHYIGPLDNRSYDAFTMGRAPFNYAENMPHDGWRDLLPFLIDTYKNGRALVTEEKIVMWHRTSLVDDCDRDWTTGNTASQLQAEFPPDEVAQDRLFFTALLASYADVVVEYNDPSSTITADWDFLPPSPEGYGGPGLYHGSVALTHAAEVNVNIVRGPVTKLTLSSAQSISPDNCDNGRTNFNAYVATSEGLEVEAVYATFNLSQMSCVAGYSVEGFNELCEFTCSWGYCPIGACVCTNLGVFEAVPNATGQVGYPANGDANYAGLCSFACNLGFCPSEYCAATVQASYIPKVSPFTPNACVAGTGNGSFAGLCSYACAFGFCPGNHCTCTEQGALVTAPGVVNTTGVSLIGFDSDLCNFACLRGYCPETACARASVIYADSSCSADQQAIIQTEINHAISIASYAALHFQEGDYYTTFFAEKARTDAFPAQVEAVYNRVAAILGGTAGYGLKVTCNFAHSMCRNHVAHMKDSKKRLNFCAGFFTTPSDQDSNDAIVATNFRLQNCPTLNLRKVNRSRGATIVHEMTHTSYAMTGTYDGVPSNDYAYGITGCMQLAAGVLDRSCTPWYLQRPHIILCPDASGKESLCDPIKSAENAESWQAVAAGVYFSSQCQRAIAISNDVPTVPVATTKKRDSSALLSIPQTAGAIRTETKHAARSLVTLMRVKRTSTTTASSTCPIYSDYYIWDLGEEVLSFTGYVHFGDSFAAGMGTGTTSWDSCRVGSNNYGQLLYSYMNDSSIPFENYACSGDTTTGLANQVKRWTDTTSPNIGTVTIGGNDVGFSDIIRNCLLREMPWSTQWYEAECEANKETARLIMNDTSSTGLTYKLKEAYLSILSASDNNNFMLYVTGYVGFFNYDTTICNLSTFQYWWPAYNPSIPETENTPFLTTDVRVELDALVDQMNGVIQQAVNDANSLYGSTSVTYVDIQPYFDTHRWCEAGVYEPDSGRGETFFFLSGWDDFVHEHDELVAADAATAAAEAAEVTILMSEGSIPLPDATTCNATLGTDPDPYAVAMCNVAVAVAAAPNGVEAGRLAQANADIASGNYSSTSIRWYLPTRQIKTFHPRTDGMYAFRDAIWDAVQDDW